MKNKNQRKRNRGRRGFQKNRRASNSVTEKDAVTGTFTTQAHEAEVLVGLNTLMTSLVLLEAQVPLVRKATMKIIALANTTPICVRLYLVAFQTGGTFTSGTESAQGADINTFGLAIDTAYEIFPIGKELITSDLAPVGNSAVNQYTRSGMFDITPMIRKVARKIQSVSTDEVSYRLACVCTGTVGSSFELHCFTTIEYDIVARRNSVL